MEIPVRFLIISVFIALIISSIYLLGRERAVVAGSSCCSHLASCLIAITAYWAMATSFFWQSLIYDFSLLPGDILCWMYPWAALFPTDTVPHNPLLGDALSNYYPWMSSLKRGIESGYLPLWNFNSYSGSPLVANFASALFNPFNLFLYLMTVPDFTTLMPFLRVVFVATGTFVFLKALKFSAVPSFIGGTLFAFAGFQIVWLSNYPNMTVVMYLPWLMLSMQKIASGHCTVWFFILIVLSSFQFLGGHPETSFHLYLLVLPYFFYQLCLQWRSGLSASVICKRVLIVGAAGVLSIGCVAFQLLPFLEYLPYTTRYFEIVEQGNNIFGSFHFLDLLKLIAGTVVNPDFFGNPVDGNYWTFANYNEQNSFFTVTGLFLCGIGIVNNAPSEMERVTCASVSHGYGKSFFIISAVAAFAMVVRLPYLHDLVITLPLFSMAANYRLIFVFVFCMVILATAGVQAFCNGGVRGVQIVIVASVLVAVALTLHLSTLNEIEPQFLNYRIEKLLSFFITLGAVTAICILAVYNGYVSLFPFIIVLMVFAESAYYGVNYNSFIDKKDIYPESPVIGYIRSQPGKYRVVGWKGALIAGAEQVYGYDSITGYDPMKIYAYEKILTSINGSYSPVFTCEIQSVDSDWLNFLNVRYIVTRPDNQDKTLKSERFSLVYDGSDGKVYENRACYPRAFRVTDLNMVKQLCNREVKERDQIQSIEITESDLNSSAPEIIKYEANEIIIHNKTTMDNGSYIDTHHINNFPSLIVLSEVWFPGWKVYVDGRPGKIEKIASTFMGVVVSGEEREIKFLFQPDSFKNGLWISLSSLFFIISLGALISLNKIRQNSYRKELMSRRSEPLPRRAEPL